jgi:release factor glutamine methyltransferase
VAYLVGRKEFYSLSLRVTPDVLIPRPETELLVVTLLDLVKAWPADRRQVTALDVGTGSGCIPIAALKHSARLRFTAVDLSPAALEVAGKNAAQHEVFERITFVESDLLAQVPPGQFDFIVSNPPYVTTAEMAALPPDIRDHEPHLALEAGPQGTDVIARLIPQAAERLTPGGHLLMEVSPMIEKGVQALLAGEKRLEPLATIKDLGGHARVVHARKV